MEITHDCIIEISGIASVFPECLKSFKQLHVQDIQYMPDIKPDIGKLLRIYADVRILETNIITSPKSVSYEGQVLTGSSLFVEGQVEQKIEYIANDDVQSITVAEFSKLFSSCIVLDEEFDLYDEVIVSSYIEDIYIKQISNRKLFVSMLFILNAEPQKIYR